MEIEKDMNVLFSSNQKQYFTQDINCGDSDDI